MWGPGSGVRLARSRRRLNSVEELPAAVQFRIQHPRPAFGPKSDSSTSGGGLRLGLDYYEQFVTDIWGPDIWGPVSPYTNVMAQDLGRHIQTIKGRRKP